MEPELKGHETKLNLKPTTTYKIKVRGMDREGALTMNFAKQLGGSGNVAGEHAGGGDGGERDRERRTSPEVLMVLRERGDRRKKERAGGVSQRGGDGGRRRWPEVRRNQPAVVLVVREGERERKVTWQREGVREGDVSICDWVVIPRQIADVVQLVQTAPSARSHACKRVRDCTEPKEKRSH
ncbi:hypothetical protein LguiB_031683 [Lonicera macranthoides]